MTLNHQMAGFQFPVLELWGIWSTTSLPLLSSPLWPGVVLFTNPSARAGYDTRSIFKRSLTGLNSEFSSSLASCLTKAEEPSLSYYLSIAGGRIIGFIPFPRVLVQCEMQSISSRIWTRIAAFISYGDNDTPLWPGVVVPIRAPSMSQIQLLDHFLKTIYVEWNCLY